MKNSISNQRNDQPSKYNRHIGLNWWGDNLSMIFCRIRLAIKQKHYCNHITNLFQTVSIISNQIKSASPIFSVTKNRTNKPDYKKSKLSETNNYIKPKGRIKKSQISFMSYISRQPTKYD